MWEYPPPPRGVKWHMFSIINDFFSSQQRYYHPRRPRGSQSGRKRPGTKVCEYGQKSPWVRTLTELFPKIQAGACSWLGTKNALYYCAQWANSFFWDRPIARNRRFWSLHGQNLISRTRGTSGHLEKFPTVLNKGNFTTKCGINKIICNTACCAMYLETSSRLRLKGWLI